MNLNAQINDLKSTLRQRDATILKLTRELKHARQYIHALTRGSSDGEDEEMEMKVDGDLEQMHGVEAHGPDEVGSHTEGVDVNIDAANLGCDDEEDTGLPQVLILDDLYVCCNCGAEVLDGACHNKDCRMGHQWPPKDPLKHDYSLETESSATHTDRSLVPRGNTPTLEDDPSLLAQHIPEIYKPRTELDLNSQAIDFPCRAEEYRELIRRGATRLMCETFQLEFTYEGGIYAWADETIFEEFSGPAMKQGHTWKIHLGRRIELGEGDFDGSVFIEDLLEDTVIFPAPTFQDLPCEAHGPWVTKEETPGVWVTRQVPSKGPGDRVAALTAHENCPTELGIALNEYEGEGEGDEDDEMEEMVDSEADPSEEDDYSTPESESSSSEDIEDSSEDSEESEETEETEEDYDAYESSATRQQKLIHTLLLEADDI